MAGYSAKPVSGYHHGFPLICISNGDCGGLGQHDRKHHLRHRYHQYAFLCTLAVFPGLALMFAVFTFNLLGDGLRDIVDPRKRT